MRKRIVRTLKSDELSPVVHEYVDDSRNPFEIVWSDNPGVDTIQVFVEVAGRWVEVLYLTRGQER